MKIDGWQYEIKVGDKVTYIPSHAKGDANHPDSQGGTISSWNDTFTC